MVMVVFVVSTLSSLHVILFLNGLVTPHTWYLINIMNKDSFLSPNLDSYSQQSTTNFSEDLPH